MTTKTKNKRNARGSNPERLPAAVFETASCPVRIHSMKILPLLLLFICSQAAAQQVLDINTTIVKDTTNQFPVHYLDIVVRYELPGNGYSVILEMEPETQFRGVLVPKQNGLGVERVLQTTNYVPKPGYIGVSWPKPSTSTTFLLTEKLPIFVQGKSAHDNIAIVTNKQYSIAPNIASYVPGGTGNIEGHIVPSQVGDAILTVTGLDKNGQPVSGTMEFSVTDLQTQALSVVTRTYRICTVPGLHKQFNGGVEYVPTLPKYTMTEQLSKTNYLFKAKVLNAGTHELLDEKTSTFPVPQ